MTVSLNDRRHPDRSRCQGHWPGHTANNSMLIGLLDQRFDVAAGEKLGVVGRTGVTVGTHVYFEMLTAGKPVDPAPSLRVPTCGREVRPPSLGSAPNSQ